MVKISDGSLILSFSADGIILFDSCGLMGFTGTAQRVIYATDAQSVFNLASAKKAVKNTSRAFMTRHSRVMQKHRAVRWVPTAGVVVAAGATSRVAHCADSRRARLRPSASEHISTPSPRDREWDIDCH